MNAVISLNHFCELHGPSVLFCTQTFHDTEDDPLYNAATDESKHKKFYGKVNVLNSAADSPASNSCEACQSFNMQYLGFISNDHENRTSYVSTRHPLHHSIATLVRQACIRSLSCEVSPGKEGPVFFGDEIRGHVLSHTFFLKDAQARGFHRWYSLTILMRDKLFLLNSWPFLVKNMKAIIEEMQAKACKVYEYEQSQCPQRALRLSADSSVYKQHSANKPSRSVAELTSDNNIFPQLHWWFTWLLKSGTSYMVERAIDVLPVKDPTPAWEQQHETEEGFMLVTAATPPQPSRRNVPVERAAPASAQEVDDELNNDESKCVSELRALREVLGTQSFLTLAYALMVGYQVVVRGQPRSLVISLIKNLKVLIPQTCCRAVLHSEEYLDPTHCNLLGLDSWVAAPQPSYTVLRVDILPTNPPQYKLTWGGTLPMKCPTVLIKIEKALENTKLSDTVVQYQLTALKEEWLNIAKITSQVHHLAAHTQDVTNLMQALGAQDHDRSLLNFWATAV
ncbi:folliculin [Schistocerca cancellata]|uniref:folliculin n=1 Tax=Schistocerca cancellata TaxID=274614 RepID=UPI002117C82D|nr:folliculin [Schistocerca cancellata]XP_049778380.1 folliculin [Schistocerca cancellata]XP_049778381.1 folliculin [Schistocerca cancellata]